MTVSPGFAIFNWEITRTYCKNPRSVEATSETFLTSSACKALMYSSGMTLFSVVLGALKLGYDLSSSSLVTRSISVFKVAGLVAVAVGGVLMLYKVRDHLNKLNALLAEIKSLPVISSNVAPDEKSAIAMLLHRSTDDGSLIFFMEGGVRKTLTAKEAGKNNNLSTENSGVTLTLDPEPHFVNYLAPGEEVEGKLWTECTPYADALKIFCSESPQDNHWMEILYNGQRAYMYQTVVQTSGSELPEAIQRNAISSMIYRETFKSQSTITERIINITHLKPENHPEYKSLCSYESQYDNCPGFYEGDKFILANQKVANAIMSKAKEEGKEPGDYVHVRYYSYNLKSYTNGYCFIGTDGKIKSGPERPTLEGKEYKFNNIDIVAALGKLPPVRVVNRG